MQHTKTMELDPEICYRALSTRDPRFDGLFFTGVRTTGVFCRPVCPARTPLAANCHFFRSAAAALEAGFRPCLRCRPEVAPHLPAANGTSNTVLRALRLIDQGSLDNGNVEDLAARLGIGERHLRRLFQEELGASTIAVAQSRRLLFARQLIRDTSLPLTDVAFASGFSSLRRFHASFRQSFGCAPRELRRAASSLRGPLTLKLPFRPPYDWAGLIGFLARRAIPGIEAATPQRYRRTFRIGDHIGRVTVAPSAGNSLTAEIELDQVTPLREITLRLRRVFDLDADPAVIATHLAELNPPTGIRVPGAWDAFELAVRAILGQQVSVQAATTLAGRLVAKLGADLNAPDPPNRIFPEPSTVAHADLTAIGIPKARAAAISGLARAIAEKHIVFDSLAHLDEAVRALKQLTGIGDWTAHYIAMRALSHPDAFPASDLGLCKAISLSPVDLERRSEEWRPWRAYAAMTLWSKLA